MPKWKLKPVFLLILTIRSILSKFDWRIPNAEPSAVTLSFEPLSNFHMQA